MQVLVMFSQYRAFVYAQSLKYKLRLYLKEIMYFSPDTNVFGNFWETTVVYASLLYKNIFR
jgi:hypothetical protein